MNIEEMTYELWEQIGRPRKDDLDPLGGLDGGVVVTAPGTRRLVKVLDWAQTMVASWKDPRLTGRAMWWTGAYRTYVGTITPITDVGQNTSGNLSQARLQTPPAVDVVGGVVRVSPGLGVGSVEEDREIVVWNAVDTAVVVSPAFVELTDGRDVMICPRWLDLDRAWRARNVHQVKMLSTAGGTPTTLGMSERGDQLNGLVEIGEPTSWVLKGNRIWFDKALAETRYVKLECECAPANLLVEDGAGGLVLTGVPELPEQFHGLVVAYAAAYGQGLLQDLEQQTMRRGQFRDDMMMTIDQADTRLDLDQGLSIKLAVK